MKIAPACIFLALAVPFSFGAPVRCGVAKDLTVQALENLKSAPSAKDIGDGIELLKAALQACPTLGDAWYYRSLFEKQLGHAGLAKFAIDQVPLVGGSDAMRDRTDPFELAAAPNAIRVSLGADPVREKWALVIGIGRFQKDVGILPHSRKDAEDFAELLADPRYGRFRSDHIRVLTDKDATTANIKGGLNWIARSADPRDLAVVFISTHGTSRNRDSVGKLNYIVTNDTDTADEDKLFGTAMPMVEISDIIRSRVKARRTAIFLDTCHSGGSKDALIHEVAPSKQIMDTMRAGVGRAIVSSSREEQLSYDSGDLENGIFTHFLIQGLKQANGRISLSAVFDYLTQQVPKAAQAEYHKPQNPVLIRSDQGADIILGVEESTRTAGLAPLFAFR